ncbi:hypothetical protein J4219_08220 [Candidatus Woesearchaeota archaeon]|nr:hypothetical protein [Candidatus Woesearchaeota archaeon]
MDSLFAQESIIQGITGKRIFSQLLGNLFCDLSVRFGPTRKFFQIGVSSDDGEHRTIEHVRI